MSYHLIIGDNTESTAKVAITMFRDSEIITTENISKHRKARCYYTSLADLDEGNILLLAKNADVVHYPLMITWKSEEFKESTEQFLTNLIDIHRIPVKNFLPKRDQLNALSLRDKRKTNEPQLWVSGCSFAYGFGISAHQRYVYKVAEHCKMQWSDLSSVGASIDWSADQILRNDIRKNDVVLWGLTGINRIDYYINDTYFAIYPNYLAHKKHVNRSDRQFFDRLIADDNNRLHQSIKHVNQVVNYINKIGAKLVLFLHKNLTAYEQVVLLEPYLFATHCYVMINDLIDYTDDCHPGPETNKQWADQIIKFLEDAKHFAAP